MSHFNFKRRPSKTTERQKLVNKLDLIFSEYIRIRHCDHLGNVKCITCGDYYHWTEVQCGHFIKRGNMATRWDLKNCGEQCMTCNCANDGMEESHRIYIENKYGEGTADELERRGRSEAHYSEHDLKQMIEELRTELKALKEEKGCA